MADDKTRIVGGSVAELGDWGWSVSLQSKGAHFCGAILVNSDYILTAAHCFYDPVKPPISASISPSQVQIFFGLHNTNSMETWVQARNAAKLYSHEKYFKGKSFYSNDIALIKLDKPVNFDKHVVPVCIDETKKINVSNKVAWATGWGAPIFQGAPTSLKKQISMNISTDRFCKAKYRTSFKSLFHICGESLENSGICQGDSGGPLVYKNPSDGLWYVVGIVSWVKEGCVSGSVFTRVSSYIDWIKQKIDLN